MRNLTYSLDGERVISREATDEELKTARDAATAKLKKDNAAYAIRSCWVCNPAHSHFLEHRAESFLFHCMMGCGHWYYQGIDITTADGEADAGG